MAGDRRVGGTNERVAHRSRWSRRLGSPRELVSQVSLRCLCFKDWVWLGEGNRS